MTLGGEILKGWEIYNLPLDDQMLAGLKFQPALTRARFEPQGSRYRDAARLLARHVHAGQGWRHVFWICAARARVILWVNGHCMGRYWNIGPSQTAYAPGCWLHAGINEIVILDNIGSDTHTVAGLEKPILSELHPEKDFQTTHRPVVKLNLDSATPVHTGSFAPGMDTQEIKFAAPATGEYFCLRGS